MKFHLVLDCSEEIVEREDRQVSLMSCVQDSEQILDRLGVRLVLHRQDEIQICLVVHLSIIGQTFLINPLDEDFSQGPGSKSCQFLHAEHSVMVSVEVQVLTIHS